MNIYECRDKKQYLARYIVEVKDLKYLVCLTSKTVSKSAENPYKGFMFLIKDNQFIPVSRASVAGRKIYSVLMPYVCKHYDNQLLIEQSLEDL